MIITCGLKMSDRSESSCEFTRDLTSAARWKGIGYAANRESDRDRAEINRRDRSPRMSREFAEIDRRDGTRVPGKSLAILLTCLLTWPTHILLTHLTHVPGKSLAITFGIATPGA